MYFVKAPFPMGQVNLWFFLCGRAFIELFSWKFCRIKSIWRIEMELKILLPHFKIILAVQILSTTHMELFIDFQKTFKYGNLFWQRGKNIWVKLSLILSLLLNLPGRDILETRFNSHLVSRFLVCTCSAVKSKDHCLQFFVSLYK